MQKLSNDATSLDHVKDVLTEDWDDYHRELCAAHRIKLIEEGSLVSVLPALTHLGQSIYRESAPHREFSIMAATG